MEIEITKEEEKKLKRIHRSLRDGKKRDRIKAILLLSQGYSATEISSILLIDNDTVTNWKKRFANREDLNSWLIDEYKIYEGKLTNQEENQLAEYIDNNFISNSKQVIKYVRERFQKSYSMSGMVSLLHKLGFVYKQRTLIPSKYDPQAQKEFKEGYEKLYKKQITNRGYNKYLKLEGETTVIIDYDKYTDDAKWDGLKGYLTNTGLSKEEIMAQYKQLWHIEKTFRISKTDLRIRPIFHYLKKRIEAHICISFAACVIYKELEQQLKNIKSQLSVEKVINILKTIYRKSTTFVGSCLISENQFGKCIFKLFKNTLKLYSVI